MESSSKPSPPFYKGAFNAMRALNKVDPLDIKIYDTQLTSFMQTSISVAIVSGFWAYFYDTAGANRFKGPKPLYYAIAIAVPSFISAIIQLTDVTTMSTAMDQKYQDAYAKEFLAPVDGMEEQKK